MNTLIGRLLRREHVTRRDLICRMIGHNPTPDGLCWWCRRCGDTVPRGHRRRQP